MRYYIANVKCAYGKRELIIPIKMAYNTACSLEKPPPVSKTKAMSPQ